MLLGRINGFHSSRILFQFLAFDFKAQRCHFDLDEQVGHVRIEGFFYSKNFLKVDLSNLYLSPSQQIETQSGFDHLWMSF